MEPVNWATWCTTMIKIMGYLGKHHQNLVEFLGVVVDQLKYRELNLVIYHQQIKSRYNDLMTRGDALLLYANVSHGEQCEGADSSKLEINHLSFISASKSRLSWSMLLKKGAQ